MVLVNLPPFILIGDPRGRGSPIKMNRGKFTPIRFLSYECDKFKKILLNSGVQGMSNHWKQKVILGWTTPLIPMLPLFPAGGGGPAGPDVWRLHEAWRGGGGAAALRRGALRGELWPRGRVLPGRVQPDTQEPHGPGHLPVKRLQVYHNSLY